MKPTNLDIKRMHNIRILMKLGLAPGTIDNKTGCDEISISLKEKVPFSSVYNNYSEYLSDIKIIEDIAYSGGDLPESIINKISITKNELGI